MHSSLNLQRLNYQIDYAENVCPSEYGPIDLMCVRCDNN
jgi:hypothetical protein